MSNAVFLCDHHTPAPERYTGWGNWADRMRKTHSQVRCQGCGRWAIWLPKAQAREINKLANAIERKIIRYGKRT